MEPIPLFFSIPSREAEILPAAERAIAALRAAGLVGRGAPRLKLALIELLTNAIEHGNGFDEGRRVTVAVRAEGPRVAVTVGDEGRGIAPHELDRELDAVPIEEKRGRGLSLVKRIVGSRPVLGAGGREVTIEFERERFA